MFETLPTTVPNTVGIKVTGKLHDEDYKSFVPMIDSVIEKEGKVRLLFEFEDFHGWDLHAAWDDMMFGVHHYNSIERLAIVGDRPCEEWLARLLKPFSRATIKYFDAAQIDDAWDWLREGIEAETSV